MNVLPENILRCMSKEDRKKLGKGGLTAEEALARAEVKNEASLQKQIVALLRLKGIEPIVSRMDRRTSNNLGTPDILFAACEETRLEIMTHACAWECKFAKGALSLDQQRMAVRMSTPPNAWIVRTIRSVDEALVELRDLGIL